MKNVLVLGAGLVSRPLVRYLLNVPEFHVKVASRTVSKAVKLIDGHPRGEARALNVRDDAQLEELVKECDLAISLLPYVYHVKVAELCIKYKKNMVTTSYISDAMKALDQRAKDAGIIILNEIGVDPGIDHMSAMRIIHAVENSGGKVISFRSYCGGLPAPEANDNPYGYKFSWSPRGVLMAGRNDAKYMKEGKIVEIDGKDLFRNHWPLHIEGEPKFETYPNRNSIPYIETYGLKDVKTMFRGTIRNIGWCKTLICIVRLGVLDETERDDLKGLAYDDLTRRLVNAQKGISTREATKIFLGEDFSEEVLDRLEWLGFFSNDQLPEENTYIDIMTARFLEKMSYKEGERDMIVLYHDFLAEWTDKKKRITSTLVDYGIPHGDSSMARTVSLPAAIATRLILQGKINITGVHAPVLPEIYNPVLDELETMNIVCKEKEYPV
ncbi:MAG: saccharopine dehydrogenase NADP-binding domain-containing protein [Candidatus Marinimicrobia bacterium]|nr:saccharopine dehydrogenase NADP-binding domain-containing protein [Candidatus Neomarinimicrobiota bacterium]